jgi:hypothetical protein
MPTWIKHSHPFPFVRAFFEEGYHRSRRLASTTVSVVSLIWGVYEFPRHGVTEILIINSVLFIVSSVSTLKQISSLRRWSINTDGARIELLNPSDLLTLSVSPSLVNSGYELLSEHDRPFLTNQSINRALVEGFDTELEIMRSSFDMKNVHDSVREKLINAKRDLGALVFDGAKVRMCDDLQLTNNSLSKLVLERTSYFSTVMTNDAVNSEVILSGRHTPVYSGREACFPRGQIPPLSKSDASNQIGASTLAITSDGFLVVMKNGPSSAIASGKMTCSGSGSSDWKDLKSVFGLTSFVRHTALRELTEELGIQVSSIDAFGVIGYGRFIDRGGKPEFFCVARLSVDRSGVTVSKPEKKFMQVSEFYELEKTIPAGPAMQNAAKYFLENHESELSNSLFWNLKLLSMADPLALSQILDVA